MDVLLASVVVPLEITVAAAVAMAAFGWVVAVRSRRVLARQQELSLDLICTASFNGHFVRLSPSWTTVLGWDRAELMRRPFADFVHPDDLQRTLDEVDKQAKSGQLVFNFQNRYLHKDGSYRWLEWTSRPDYKAGLMFAVARDISDRKGLEEAQARYKDELEQAVRARTESLQQRNEELDQLRQENLRRLAMAAEYRDDQTFEHTERVGRTAALLAGLLGFSDPEVQVIRQAAPLHDIGKLGVSDAILLKPGKLTPAEYADMQRHTEHGSALLAGSSSQVLQLAAEIARGHHEWWDGSGYPDGLAGEQIPLSARIVAVADVFDALTHERPYKPAWNVADAVEELRRLSGRQFDPAVIQAFGQLDPNHLAGLADLAGHNASRYLRAAS